MQLNNDVMGKILAFVGACALFLFMWGSCSSCKVRKTTIARDSIVYKVKDSIRLKTVVNRKDSTVIKDTLIRVKYDRAQYSFDAKDTKDTAVRSGRATLRKTVNNGVVTVQADCDSFYILVTDLKVIISQKDEENNKLVSEFQEYKKTHSDSTVTVKEPSRIARIWGNVRNLFAWVGLVTILYFIYKVYRRFTL